MPLAVHFVAFHNDLVVADPAGPLSLALDGAAMFGPQGWAGHGR